MSAFAPAFAGFKRIGTRSANVGHLTVVCWLPLVGCTVGYTQQPTMRLLFVWFCLRMLLQVLVMSGSGCACR